MHILQLYSGQNIHTGDFIYRIQVPAQGLSSLAGITVENLDLLDVDSKSILIDAPLLILHHLTDPDLLPVVAERRKLGLPTIYELADNFHTSHEYMKKTRPEYMPDYRAIVAELIKRCDAVQSPTSALKNRFKYLNSKFFVFQNVIAEVNAKNEKQNSSEKLIVGWGGSARHFADLAHFAPAIIDWILKHADVQLAIMGSKRIQTLFRRLPANQLLTHEPGSLEDYFSFLNKLHVGLAPLLPNEFNACRSDVKYLEYAAYGVVPLCSRFGPYLELGGEGQRILLFENAEELIAHLEFLRYRPEKIKQIARDAHQWVEKRRRFRSDHWQKRANIYKQLLKDVNSPCNSDRKNSENGLKPKISKLLMQGINSLQPEKSLLFLKKAVDLYPYNYQVHYFYGWALSKSGNYLPAVKALKQAMMIRPDSIRTAQLLAQVFVLAGNVNLALSTVENALKIEPDLPTLLQLKAIILKLKKYKLDELVLHKLRLND